jgi:hypothetical protein
VAREAVAEGASFHGEQKIALNIKIANLKSMKPLSRFISEYLLYQF